jgi:hypothetical protein
MTEVDSAVVRWRPARSVEEIAACTSDLLSRVAAVDATMRRWFIPEGRPRRRHPLPAGEKVEFLAREGVAGASLPQLPDAFILRLWNGENGA